MNKVNILFSFETKEQWSDFGEKFFSNSLFTKYSPVAKKLSEHKATFNEVVQGHFDKEIDFILDTMVYVETQSEKALRLLNDWIKENNYTNNYTIRDNKDNRIGMDLDGLFEWWSENKDMYYEKQIAELENKLHNLPESNYKKYSDDIDILNKAIEVIKEIHGEKPNKRIRKAIKVIKFVIDEYQCRYQLELEEEADKMKPLVWRIQYLKWERTASPEEIEIYDEMCRIACKSINDEPLTDDEEQYLRQYHDIKDQINRQIHNHIWDY